MSGFGDKAIGLAAREGFFEFYAGRVLPRLREG
jgi:hypothetical protein